MTDNNNFKIDPIVQMIEESIHHSDSVAQSILEKQIIISNQLTEIANSDNSWLYVIFGAILGLFLTLAWNYIIFIKKNCYYKSRLKKYEGFYLAYNKYDNDDRNPFRCFDLKLKANRFKIVNGISMLGYEDYKGEINMLDFNLNFGNGYFQHNKAPDNFIGFGFLEIQLTGDEILVHETIYNKNGHQNSDPYRWIKKDPEDIGNLKKQYRQIQQEKYKIKYQGLLKNDN